MTAGGPYPWIIINALGERFGPIDVVLEESEGRVSFLKRRAKKIGWLLTLGQFMTMMLLKLCKTVTASRSKVIVAQYGVRSTPDTVHRVVRTSSVNSHDCRELLGRLQPQVILLVGCRLLRGQTLAAVHCPVINYHAGITPKYRGMNGGYFARASGDLGNFGATVHLVDAGVDTGAVLYQVRIEPEANDNISTYPMLLAAVSRDICIAAVGDAINQRLRTITVDLPSRQWFHPTIWSYLWIGLTKRVW
jgi:folate-dependent phosphoribosylglycinamide formyltransferase PurN